MKAELKAYWGSSNQEQIERFNVCEPDPTFDFKSDGIEKIGKNLTTLKSYLECLPYIEQENELRAEHKNKDEQPFKVFISHSSKDKLFVKALVELLEFLGINSKEKLLCSSVTGYGVPIRENICDYIFKQFEEYQLIVLVVHSDSYYSSPLSLNEMGAAWVVRSKIYSMLVKGFDFGKMEGVVNGVDVAIKVDADDAKERMNQLKDDLVPLFKPEGIDQTRWEEKRDVFLAEVNAL